MQMDVECQNQDKNYNIYSIVISQVMRDQEQLPSLPSLTLKIRTAIADPNASGDSLAELISIDPSLCALLMKTAASPFYKRQVPAQSIQDVIVLLGIQEVDRVALLSEVGTLAVLSAFRDLEHQPDTEVFFKLSKEYSKSLGLILLKKWNLQEEYVEVLRNLGKWHLPSEGKLNLLDIENLGLYHSIRVLDANADLPPLDSLPAYQKLDPAHRHISSNQQLTMISLHRQEIMTLAKNFG